MALHRRIGFALEARPTTAAPADLARHFVEAAPLGEVERAGRHSVLAATAAITALAYEESADIARRALALPIDDATRSELLLLLGRSGIDAGDSPEAHQAFLDAFHAARAAGDPVRLGRAALGATRGFRGGSEWMPEAARRALVAEALSVVPSEETALRVELLGQLALWTTEPVERQRLAASAMDAVEHDPSPAALVAAYGASRIVLWQPERTPERISFADRVSFAAMSLKEPLLAANVAFGTLGDLLQLGERAAVDRLLVDLDGNDALRRSRRLRWQRALWVAVMAFVDGRFDDAEVASANALEVWGDEAHVDALQAFGNQLAGVRVLQGRGGEIVEPLLDWVAAQPNVSGFRAGLSWALAQTGRDEEAADQLAAVLQAGLPRDNTYPATWISAAHAAHLLSDRVAAASLYELGRPLARQLIFQPGPALFVGPADHGLGLLAATLGRTDLAAAHFATSIDVAGRCGPWWAERSQRSRDALN